MADFSADQEQRYLAAVARREAIEALWIREGEPVLASGSTGQLVEHPLVKMLREHDLLLDRMRPRQMGRPPLAVLSPAPAAKLRQVK